MRVLANLSLYTIYRFMRYRYHNMDCTTLSLLGTGDMRASIRVDSIGGEEEAENVVGRRLPLAAPVDCSA